MSYSLVLERIAEAAARAGRQPGDVTLVGVTKNRTAEQARELSNRGLRDFGENRVQEARDKLQGARAPGGWLASPAARLHLIGHLQGNKARAAVALFDTIHTVDTIVLAERLERLAGEQVSPPRRLQVLVQVKTSEEPTKAGVSPEEAERLLVHVAGLPHLSCTGLMTMAEGGALIGDDRAARTCFIMLRRLAERHAALFCNPGRVELSMGMSRDYEVAIEEGATMVRVGTALFAPPEIGTAC